MWPSDKKVWKPSKVWAVLVLIAEILQKQQALPLILNWGQKIVYFLISLRTDFLVTFRPYFFNKNPLLEKQFFRLFEKSFFWHELKERQWINKCESFIRLFTMRLGKSLLDYADRG